jgi:hypothetical protein
VETALEMSHRAPGFACMTPSPAATLAPPSEVVVGVDRGVARLTELAGVLGAMSDLAARAVMLLSEVVRDGLAEKIAGLPVDLWLSQIARQTRVDRNLLLPTVEVLRDMPALGQALAEGRVAWSQVVRIVYEVRSLRRVQRRELDRLLGDAIEEHRAYAPDDLVITVAEHPQHFATLAEALEADLPAPPARRRSRRRVRRRRVGRARPGEGPPSTRSPAWQGPRRQAHRLGRTRPRHPAGRPGARDAADPDGSAKPSGPATS